MYAHGELEIRPSSLNWCTRIIYDNGRRTIEGCCNPGHTIQHCQLQQASGVWMPPHPGSTNLPVHAQPTQAYTEGEEDGVLEDTEA
jgi:hypothetical protein